MVKGAQGNQVEPDEELDSQIRGNGQVQQEQMQNGEENQHQQVLFEVEQGQSQVKQRLCPV